MAATQVKTNRRCRTYLRVNSVHNEPPSQDHKVNPDVVNAANQPLSYLVLRSIYGYPTYPAPTTGHKRVTVGIVIAYLHRTNDGSANISKSTMPSDIRAFCAMNGYTAPTFLSPIILGNSVAPISFPTGGPFFVEAAPSGCPLDPYDSANNPGWPLEASLDVQSVFGMTNTNGPATGPNIILVHAKSDSFTDLDLAISQAVTLGADVISMSWGSSEFLGEAAYDTFFTSGSAATRTFVASTGDDAYGSYPAFSPYVIAVGGTSLNVSSGGARITESVWGNDNGNGNSGGGVSGSTSGPVNSALPVQEPVPSYQLALGYRGRAIPDISSFANPNPGVVIALNTFVPPRGTPNTTVQYWIVGGTSVSAPCQAACIATANQLRVNNNKTILTSTQALTAYYNAYASTTPTSYCRGYIYNIILGLTYLYTQTTITIGSGRYQRTITTWGYLPDNSAVPVPTSKGYDLATGLGVPSVGLIPYLASV